MWNSSFSLGIMTGIFNMSGLGVIFKKAPGML